MTDEEIICNALLRVLHVSAGGYQMSVNPGWSYLTYKEMDAVRRYMEEREWRSYHDVPGTDPVGYPLDRDRA